MPRYILETETLINMTDVERVIGEHLKGYVTLKPQARDLHIIGRRWWQKSYGNTYCTAEIEIDGKTVHRTPMQTGSGDFFLTAAVDWLKSAGHLPEEARGTTLYLREMSGFDFSYEVHDVERQRDL